MTQYIGNYINFIVIYSLQQSFRYNMCRYYIILLSYTQIFLIIPTLIINYY